MWNEFHRSIEVIHFDFRLFEFVILQLRYKITKKKQHEYEFDKNAFFSFIRNLTLPIDLDHC